MFANNNIKALNISSKNTDCDLDNKISGSNMCLYILQIFEFKRCGSSLLLWRAAMDTHLLP